MESNAAVGHSDNRTDIVSFHEGCGLMVYCRLQARRDVGRQTRRESMVLISTGHESSCLHPVAQGLSFSTLAEKGVSIVSVLGNSGFESILGQDVL